jgi:hypothetical protein
MAYDAQLQVVENQGHTGVYCLHGEDRILCFYGSRY